MVAFWAAAGAGGAIGGLVGHSGRGKWDTGINEASVYEGRVKSPVGYCCRFIRRSEWVKRLRSTPR